MMLRLKMENLTIAIIVLSLVVYFLECAIVEGKTLNPIYWNSSNPLFKMHARRNHMGINAAINDKLDIICPRKGRDDGEELFYFKLYLVNEENFRKCNATGGKRLITCDVPNQEKKYTFYFQEISPSPWGLEFVPEKSYYVVSTSDGTQSGMNGLKGGVCTQFNMKIELKIHAAEDSIVNPPVVKPPKDVDEVYSEPPEVDDDKGRNVGQRDDKGDVEKLPEVDEGDTSSTKTNSSDQFSGSGMIIGIVVGAVAVIIFVCLAFVAYRIYKRRQHHKKYQSPPITPTRGNTPLQQVTLLPISPASHHGHHHHHGRLHSDHERHRSATLSSHSDLRPPPSYNESFLDNGGPVVAV